MRSSMFLGFVLTAAMLFSGSCLFANAQEQKKSAHSADAPKASDTRMKPKFTKETALNSADGNRSKVVEEIGRVDGPRDMNMFKVEPTVQGGYWRYGSVQEFLSGKANGFIGFDARHERHSR